MDNSSQKDLTHIPILKSFDEIPFLIGKKTIVDFVKGNPNKTIEKNNLDELNSFGVLFKEDIPTLFSIIRELINHNYIEEVIISGFPVIRRTPRGKEEIVKREFSMSEVGGYKNYNLVHSLNPETIAQDDLNKFEQLDFFLNSYNNEQKKAIISDKQNILCIAGAGTGKTTVLVKRIDFLKKLKSVEERKILAITFTRKARDEMRQRLNSLGIYNVEIETFNSFSEKILKKNQEKFYDRETKVIEFKDKISILRYCFEKIGIIFDDIKEDYFSKKQLREKSREELFLIFVHDIFSMLDHFKNSKKPINKFYEKENNPKRKRVSKLIYSILNFCEQELQNRGLRDFTDQINHLIMLFENNPETIPAYDHILVDEFQDVNVVQLELLQKIKTKNLFCVGDPRQAIYGWRGSQIQYILDFPKIFENSQVLSLTKNYRSSNHLVSFFNLSIESLNLSPLEPTIENMDKELFVVEQDSEMLERIFIVEAVKNSVSNYGNIFVLARTNKIIEQISDEFSKQKIDHVIKTEDEYKTVPKENAVVLATIHSIKGMEAEEVYLVGANTNNFPNKVQDNFVMSLIKEDDTYDKEAEELRLFYVGITRAKKKLVITYTKSISKFVSQDMLNIADFKPKQKTLFSSRKLESTNDETMSHYLKSWRTKKAEEIDLPSYMILSNKTIDELVSNLPSNKDELLQITGMGPGKVAKFGDEILAILNGE